LLGLVILDEVHIRHEEQYSHWLAPLSSATAG